MASSHSPSSSSPSSLHLKTLIPNSISAIKDETNREEQQMSKDVCGICFADYGEAIRGELDCCNHFFCFVCIMMWAKIESRCPTCKRRFTTIRRPPKLGVFPVERIVNVPKRDQVYHPFGNMSIGPFDPYAEVGCRVCNSSADESLLLLCDLCDSAAHTYCVGLGATVPEGDWFCHDCEVSRAERENNTITIDYSAGNHNENLNGHGMVIVTDEPRVSRSDVVDNQHNLENSGDVNDDVSILDIVHESDTPLFGWLRPRVSHRHVPLARECNIEDEVIEPVERSPPTARTQTRATTLSRCRDVNGYIQALRENWDALRSGSLCFSSGSVQSTGSNGSRKRKYDTVLQDSLDQPHQPHSSPSTSGPQLTTRDGLLGFTSQDRQSYDINKAWKMMDRAKSIIHQSSKYPSGKGCLLKGETNKGLGLHLLKKDQFGAGDLGKSTTKKQYKHYYLGKQTEKIVSSKFEKERQNKVMSKEIIGSSDSLSTGTCSPQFSASISSCRAQTSSRGGDVCQKNGEKLSQKNLCRGSLHITNEKNGSSLTTLVGSVPGVLDSLNAKLERSASSSCKRHISEGEVRLVENYVQSKARYDDAKSQVQSLVKLDLKLLSRDKHLQVDAFKEVARCATHTILAACGLGSSRSVIHSFPSSVCIHSEQIQQLRKSTLMPNSCRECFYVFVKDVVNSILSEKVCPAES